MQYKVIDRLFSAIYGIFFQTNFDVYMLRWWLITSHLLNRAKVRYYVRQYYAYSICFNEKFTCEFFENSTVIQLSNQADVL